MTSPDEARCKHGEVADWCGESECMAARKGLPVRVWRTSQGEVYHRGPACEALRDHTKGLIKANTASWAMGYAEDAA